MSVRAGAWASSRILSLRAVPRLDRFTVRVAILVGLGVLYFGIYEHSQWLVQPGTWALEVPRVPVPSGLWYATGWILFGALLCAMLVAPAAARVPASDLWPRRLVILAVWIVGVVKVGNRLLGIGFFGVERSLGVAGLFLGILATAVVLVALLRWTPPTWLLAAVLLLGGFASRTVLSLMVPQNPDYADNLVVIELGLRRLVSGATPYAVYDLGAQSNAMPYLPWTFLSYLPGYLVGMDVRLTNTILSLALVLGVARLVQVLPIPPVACKSLVLVMAAFYVLPRSIGNDLYTEFPMMNLALVLAFSLIALGRWRLAAAAYGVALGAMPLALYCAVPLACLALHARPWRQVILLTAITVGVAVLPVFLFLAWDAGGFVSAVFGDFSAVWRSDSRLVQTPFRLAWQATPETTLRFVQGLLFLLLMVLAVTRVRSVYALIAIAAVSYLTLVLSGPFVMPHFLEVVLYLAVLAEAARLAQLAPASPSPQWPGADWPLRR